MRDRWKTVFLLRRMWRWNMDNKGAEGEYEKFSTEFVCHVGYERDASELGRVRKMLENGSHGHILGPFVYLYLHGFTHS